MVSRNLILAGGGGAEDSKSLDELFLKLVGKGKVLYIPIAWKSSSFEQCRQWFAATFGALGFTNWEMWTDLIGKKYSDLEKFSGIYIGGGNTFSLLHDLRKTGFDKVLLKFLDSGKPVYGGSAGAIIMGKTVETASFGEHSDENISGLQDLSGFDLVGGYAIQCHYKQDQKSETTRFAKSRKIPVISLTERTGLHVKDGVLTVLGFETASVFEGDGIRKVRPGGKV